MKHIKVDIENYDTNKKEVLKKISFVLNESDRIAIVWLNWVGKTTLFKILSWEIKDFFWSIVNCGSLTFGYLSQIHFDDEFRLVKEELRLAFPKIISLKKELLLAEEKMSKNSSNENIEKYIQILEKFNAFGWYNYEYEIHRVANWLGIIDLFDKSIKEVSWWQRTKIALAKILLEKPDFLLLDEPTNFIDLASTEWLEKYLCSIWKWGYMVISHDRDFLDKTCQKTYEITWPRPLEFYNGNYTYYVKEKAKKEATIFEDYERQQEYINSQTKLINRFRAWSRAGWAKSREKMIDKMDLIEKPIISHKPKFTFIFDKLSENKVLYFKEAFIGRKDPLFFINEAGLTLWQKIWIIWENGVGKSTFIKTILGQIDVLDWIMNIGKWLKISYFSQLHEELDIDITLRENFIKHWFDYETEKLVAIISNYLFNKEDINKKVKEFSGWQISKLLFAILGQKESNFLIFDEPTNHLDYDFREALEQELAKYKWIILFISHDRYFINKIATHLWIIKDNELFINYGNYEDYLYKKERWLNYDMSLFDEEAQLNLTLQDKLWEKEARRIREKFGRKKR
jgi:ATP-binding cassette, subfamily F, member 3